MQHLSIAATKSTPSIEYSPGEKTLSIFGESYPEDAAKFYRPVLEWLQKLLAAKPDRLQVVLFIRYLNTSSSKCVMTLLDSLESAYANGINVSVLWRYEKENEMALECGEEFGEDLSLPYKIEGIEG